MRKKQFSLLISTLHQLQVSYVPVPIIDMIHNYTLTRCGERGRNISYYIDRFSASFCYTVYTDCVPLESVDSAALLYDAVEGD
jgi:hypothetical protein